MARSKKRYWAGKAATNRIRPSDKVEWTITETRSHMFLTPIRRLRQPSTRVGVKPRERDCGGKNRDPVIRKTRGESGGTQTKDIPNFGK